MKLSIIILNYNVTQWLRNCLLSIEKYVHNFDYEVIVIDNQSPDVSWKDLIAEFPQVKFIENSSNEGFAKANNKAVKTAKGEYILLLNPDTELEGNYMREILDFADAQENLGCLGSFYGFIISFSETFI
jgi:GT2 family glycosyltransferase